MRISFRNAGDKQSTFEVANVGYFEPLGNYYNFTLLDDDNVEVHTIETDNEGNISVWGKTFDFMELYAE